MTSPSEHNDDRREFLKKAGTFAAVTPPAVTFLLSTSMSSQAIAKSGGGPRGNGKPKGNNGVGNGQDGPPPGNPKVNDGPGSGPGNPGSHGASNNANGNGKSHIQYNPGHGHGHG